MDNIVPGFVQRQVTVRSFDDIQGYEQSLRLATSSMVAREAPNFNGWHAKIDLGRVKLNSAEYSASLSTRSTVRWPRFFFLTGNGRPARVSGHDFDHGMINYIAEHGDVSVVSNKHMAWTSIEFAPELLTNDFEVLDGWTSSNLEHGAMFAPADIWAWNRLEDVCRTALRLGMIDAAAFNAEAAAAATAGALIDAVASCLTNGAQEADRAAIGRQRLILRRMIDAIEGDHRANLTMASLCHAANVSARTLHEVAMSYLGMPPARYLRNHRLRRVYETLRDAAPDSTTVAVAMTRNGLWELERAVSAYRDMFGQNPSDTLNKGPCSAVAEQHSAGSRRLSA